MKLCLKCFTVIPSMASRCPNCLDDHQGAWGRILLLILVAAASLWLLDRCAERQWPFDGRARMEVGR